MHSSATNAIRRSSQRDNGGRWWDNLHPHLQRRVLLCRRRGSVSRGGKSSSHRPLHRPLKSRKQQRKRWRPVLLLLLRLEKTAMRRCRRTLAIAFMRRTSASIPNAMPSMLEPTRSINS